MVRWPYELSENICTGCDRGKREKSIFSEENVFSCIMLKETLNCCQRRGYWVMVRDMYHIESIRSYRYHKTDTDIVSKCPINNTL